MSNKTAAAQCERLVWDSEFFRLSIARVAQERLAADEYESVLAWSGENRIDCLYYKLAIEEDVDLSVPPRHGFMLVDVRVELSAALDAVKPAALPAGIRVAAPDDITPLQAIAAVSHKQTRFYSDARFPRAACDELYRTWIARSCEGWADAVLVAADADRCIGYVTLHLQPPVSARIGLIAVADDMRAHGIGSRLVYAAIQWARSRGVNRLHIATQGANTGALRLYERSGFLTSCVYLWYHRWFTGAARP